MATPENEAHTYARRGHEKGAHNERQALPAVWQDLLRRYLLTPGSFLLVTSFEEGPGLISLRVLGIGGGRGGAVSGERVGKGLTIADISAAGFFDRWARASLLTLNQLARDSCSSAAVPFVVSILSRKATPEGPASAML